MERWRGDVRSQDIHKSDHLSLTLQPFFHSKSKSTIIMASEASIKSAFRSGDDDADDGLSLSEASRALEKLTGGAHIDESTIEEACESVGVSIGSREMDGKF